jgi:hypothetical protein
MCKSISPDPLRYYDSYSYLIRRQVTTHCVLYIDGYASVMTMKMEFPVLGLRVRTIPETPLPPSAQEPALEQPKKPILICHLHGAPILAVSTAADRPRLSS